MQLFLLTSGGRQSQPAHSHFQPAWSPTPAKPAGEQNTGNSKQHGGNLDSIAGILQGLKRSCSIVSEWELAQSGRCQCFRYVPAGMHFNIQNSNGCKTFMRSKGATCNYDSKLAVFSLEGCP